MSAERKPQDPASEPEPEKGSCKNLSLRNKAAEMYI
jgi:hypothetical protein